MLQNLYQLVLTWKMTKEEATAFHLVVLYLELSHRYFPDYKHARLPKKGDPRKSILFKYCWKLMQDKKDELKPEDYRHYIQAQMTVLKNIKIGDVHPYIDPNCLVGESAWKRWTIWKKYFTEVKKLSDVVEETTDFTKEIKKALQETHYALKVRLGELSKDKVLEEMPFVLRLCRMNVVSPYFIAMSPTVINYVKQNKLDLGVEMCLYQKVINDEAIECYEELFGEI